eukprot:49141-Rhodomonas_salina.1
MLDENKKRCNLGIQLLSLSRWRICDGGFLCKIRVVALGETRQDLSAYGRGTLCPVPSQGPASSTWWGGPR